LEREFQNILGYDNVQPMSAKRSLSGYLGHDDVEGKCDGLICHFIPEFGWKDQVNPGKTLTKVRFKVRSE
jgi:hypothetical protein